MNMRTPSVVAVTPQARQADGRVSGVHTAIYAIRQRREVVQQRARHAKKLRSRLELIRLHLVRMAAFAAERIEIP